MKYLDHNLHSKFLKHYEKGNCANLLIFTEDWMEQNLSLPEPYDSLNCELLDTQTNITYNTLIYCACEKHDYTVYDDEYNDIAGSFYTLMNYFYCEHHCPCHRHQDAVRAGLKENWEEFECNGNRFQIVSIKPKNSDVILYSETYRLEELEEKLKGNL
jgi:hypothetical protein